VEPSFRETKDLRFGMGLSSARISDPQRREKAARHMSVRLFKPVWHAR
jgi:hypothetical protein